TTRLMSSPAALYSTTRPKAATAASVSSSGMSTTSLPSSGEPSALRGLAPHSILASDIVFGNGGRLRREVRIHDLARDRRGRAAAAAAVLDDHGDRDPRRVGRRIRDEEPVVAMPLVDLVLVVARV